MELLHLYISTGHNYFGHHGRPPGVHPVLDVPEVRCLAGRGVEGDRFLDHAEKYKGQITFFGYEVYEALCQQFQIFDKSPGAFRRNVITRGVDLNQWIGVEFELQGVCFRGVEPCKPCHWMDHAFCPGAEKALQGRGGLRAMIVTGGVLRVSRCSGSRVLLPRVVRSSATKNASLR